MPDWTLVQTPQGEVKKLTVDEFVELGKTTFFKKNVGHEKKVARLDKQGNPVKDKMENLYIRAENPTDGWLNREDTRHWHSRIFRRTVLYQKQTPTVNG